MDVYRPISLCMHYGIWPGTHNRVCVGENFLAQKNLGSTYTILGNYFNMGPTLRGALRAVTRARLLGLLGSIPCLTRSSP